MDILLSIIGSAVLAVLLSVAYTAGVCAGKAATHMEEDDEPKIYICLLYTSPSPRDCS